MPQQTMSGFAPIMCAHIPIYFVVMVLHQTPARKGKVRYTARVKLVLTPTSVERQESGDVRTVQWNPSITDTFGHQHFVRYSGVSRPTQGLPVYFR